MLPALRTVVNSVLPPCALSDEVKALRLVSAALDQTVAELRQGDRSRTCWQWTIRSAKSIGRAPRQLNAHALNAIATSNRPQCRFFRL
jgi:hypothetical protein